jgi:hypothetical protein
MSRGFGTSGLGTTDVITTPLTTVPQRRSWFFWAYRTGAGGNSLGRLFDTVLGTTGGLLLYDNAGTNYSFVARWTVDGTWNFALGSVPTNTWHSVGLSYDNGSTANNPVAYFNGASVSFSSFSNPTGSPTLTTSGITIGNSGTGLRNFDGIIRQFAIWDCLLTPEEFRALHFGLAPSKIRPKLLQLYYPMTNPGKMIEDMSLYRRSTTNQSSVFSANNPSIVPIQQRADFWPGIDALGWIIPRAAPTIEFRRTLSPVGTRIGARQIQGWSQ